MATICMLGASKNWVPPVVTDLMAVFEEPLEVRMVDVKPEAAEVAAAFGEAASRHHGREDRFVATTDRRAALRGADAVVLTLSVGGLDAFEHDLVIPEKYGIFATVGDTTGPAGWSWAVRTIPFFRQFAEDFEELCPEAFIVNYSNPMAALTATLQQCCGNPVVGLCHAYYQTKRMIGWLFGLEDDSSVSLAVAGMNHFTWVTDFRVGRQDGYAALREKVGGGSLRDILPPEPEWLLIYRGWELFAELYDTFGYLPYPGDRHTAEFLSFTLSGFPKRYEVEAGAGGAGGDHAVLQPAAHAKGLPAAGDTGTGDGDAGVDRRDAGLPGAQRRAGRGDDPRPPAQRAGGGRGQQPQRGGRSRGCRWGAAWRRSGWWTGWGSAR